MRRRVFDRGRNKTDGWPNRSGHRAPVGCDESLPGAFDSSPHRIYHSRQNGSYGTEVLGTCWLDAGYMHYTHAASRSICCDRRSFHACAAQNTRCVPNANRVEMSLYREFPWIPWVPCESHGNGKYPFCFVRMGKSMGIAWWLWEGIKTLHFPFPTLSRPTSLTSTYTIGR